MGAGTTRLQIMLDKKMVTPQPLAVPDLRAEKDTKTLEKTYHGDPKLLRSDTRGLGKFKVTHTPPSFIYIKSILSVEVLISA